MYEPSYTNYIYAALNAQMKPPVRDKQNLQTLFMLNSLRTEVFLRKMVPSESDFQELSNEWSCQYVSTILKYFGQFLCSALDDRCHHHGIRVTDVTITASVFKEFTPRFSFQRSNYRNLKFACKY
jgi:hypothetical protein